MLVAREVVNSPFALAILVSKETDTTVQVGFIMSSDLTKRLPPPPPQKKLPFIFVSKFNGNETISSFFLSCVLNADIDECESAELHECDPNALCTNVEGFYICRCLRGYEGDGQFCAGKEYCSSKEYVLFCHAILI